MKRFIYSIVALFTLGCTFVSCGDDNDDPVINYDTTAEQGSAGTYTGTWLRTSDDGSTDSYSGTVTLAASGTPNVTNVTFSCPETSIEATSIANVWHANYSFHFVNQTTSDSNKLGATFAGIIDEAGNLNVAFTISQKVGRKNYEFKYEFKGKK